MLSQEALKDFKKIWKEDFKEDISDELAVDEAINLLTIMDKIYRPVKEEWLNEHDNETNLQNKRKNINLG